MAPDRGARWQPADLGPSGPGVRSGSADETARDLYPIRSRPDDTSCALTISDAGAIEPRSRRCRFRCGPPECPAGPGHPCRPRPRRRPAAAPGPLHPLRPSRERADACRWAPLLRTTAPPRRDPAGLRPATRAARQGDGRVVLGNREAAGPHDAHPRARRTAPPHRPQHRPHRPAAGRVLFFLPSCIPVPHPETSTPAGPRRHALAAHSRTPARCPGLPRRPRGRRQFPQPR